MSYNTCNKVNKFDKHNSELKVANTKEYTVWLNLHDVSKQSNLCCQKSWQCFYESQRGTKVWEGASGPGKVPSLKLVSKMSFCEAFYICDLCTFLQW